MGRKLTGRLNAEEALAATDLEGFIGYNLKRAYVTVQTDFRATLGDDGLGTRVFSALSLVVQFPQISQSELARMLGIERSGLVAIVDELEKRGYLIRTTVPGDRRVQALVPTSDGNAAYQSALDAVKQHEDRLLSHLKADEKQSLLHLLRKVRQSDRKDKA